MKFSRFRAWIGRSAKSPRSDHRLKKKKGFARSARTRRSVRRRREEFGGAGVVVVQYGVVRNVHLVRCSVDSVKHTTSPSRRDRSRRVLHVACASTSIRRFRTPKCSGRYAARTSVSSRQPACRLRVPRCWCWPVPASPCPERIEHAQRPRNQDTEQPFSYCYELRTQHRLESVATRTPPPICASALGSLNRAGLESLGRREPSSDTALAKADNPLNRRTLRLFATVATLQLQVANPSF